MKPNYSYQIKAANKVLENALDKRYLASILAACPNSGKTTISHIIINNYLKLFPEARVLILTEGQKTLKHQYLDELDNANIDIEFSYGDFYSDAQVRVGIPQGISKLDWSKIDLLIVDECHNFFLKKMDQRIISKLQPEHLVIMTGTPSKFNKYNQKRPAVPYGMYYISAEELQSFGVFSAVDLDVIRSDSNIFHIWNKILEKRPNMEKVMIACKDINQAEQMGYFLNEKGYCATISTSLNDPLNENLEDFKKGKYNILLVVNKGNLGFNDKNITTLIDLKSSENIDTSFQLFARILRKHPDNIRKSYFRIAYTSYNKEVIILHKIVSLMSKDTFRDFNGSNLQVIQCEDSL